MNLDYFVTSWVYATGHQSRYLLIKKLLKLGGVGGCLISFKVFVNLCRQYFMPRVYDLESIVLSMSCGSTVYVCKSEDLLYT